MTAYANLQEREFELAAANGYSAVRHQRFVGTGYFDALQTVITGGRCARPRWTDRRRRLSFRRRTRRRRLRTADQPGKRRSRSRPLYEWHRSTGVRPQAGFFTS